MISRPADFWKTPLVRLRAIEPEDAGHFIQWNRDSERGRNLDFLWPPTSDASVREYATSQAHRHLEGDAFHWMIEDASGQAVGSIDTHHCDPRNGTFSYGIAIGVEYRGRGCAAAAIRLVLRYYFDELRYQKVTVTVHADNPASIQLHEKLGFQREGVLRRMFYTGGAYVDVIWYGLTAEEFRSV